MIISTIELNSISSTFGTVQNNRNGICRTIIGNGTISQGQAGLSALGINDHTAPGVATRGEAICLDRATVVNYEAVAVAVVDGHVFKGNVCIVVDMNTMLYRMTRSSICTRYSDILYSYFATSDVEQVDVSGYITSTGRNSNIALTFYCKVFINIIYPSGVIARSYIVITSCKAILNNNSVSGFGIVNRRTKPLKVCGCISNGIAINTIFADIERPTRCPRFNHRLIGRHCSYCAECKDHAQC